MHSFMLKKKERKKKNLISVYANAIFHNFDTLTYLVFYLLQELDTLWI